MNNLSIVGRLTKDAELRFAAGSGTPVARFTLAVTRKFKRDETDFIPCVAFGKAAEIITQHTQKGSQLGVTGSLRSGSYDAQDGTKRYTMDVIVETFDFLGGGSNTTIQGDNLSQPNNVDQNMDQFSGGFGGSFDDNDITPVDDGDMPF